MTSKIITCCAVLFAISWACVIADLCVVKCLLAIHP